MIFFCGEMKKRKMNKVPLIDGHAHLEELEDLSELLQEARHQVIVADHTTANASQFFQIPFNNNGIPR